MSARMISMQDADFQKMSDKNLERMLLDYSKTRKGEIADLIRAAAIRIGVLSAKAKQLEVDKGDDLNMILDEAIAHAEDVADKQNEIAFELNTTYNAVTEYSKECSKCAEDHRQLAEWLKDYKRLKEQEPCDDAISRAQAIYVASGYCHPANVARELEKLPSVKPAEIKEPCEDCISRQAVIELAKKGVLISNRNYESVCKAINELPPVTPQPKSGYWIDKDIRGSIEPYCSVCGDSVDTIYHYNYCPNCGAMMVVS